MHQFMPVLMTLLFLFAVYCTRLNADDQNAAAEGNEFPMVDYHVHLEKGLTIDEAKAWADVHGMKYGIAGKSGIGTPVKDDAGLLAVLAEMKDKGVYVGIQVEGREWVEMFSPEVMAQFDYVITHVPSGDLVCTGFTRHCAVNAKGTPVGIDEKTLHLWAIFPK